MSAPMTGSTEIKMTHEAECNRNEADSLYCSLILQNCELENVGDAHHCKNRCPVLRTDCVPAPR